MKITMIGKWGGYPEEHSATSSFLLEQDDFRLLVDCGSGVLSKIQQYTSPAELNGVILSHYHHDHVADVGVLQYYTLIQTQLGNRRDPLHFYGHTRDQKQFEALNFGNYTVAREIAEGQLQKLGPFEVDFLPTIHPVYCLAIRLKANGKTLVYSADTEWNEALIQFSKDADVLICEASLYNQQKGKVSGHLTAGEVGELANLAHVKKVILTHLPHYGKHEQLVIEAKEKYEGEVLLAEAGLITEC